MRASGLSLSLFNKWHFAAAAFVQKRAIKAIKQPGALSARATIMVAAYSQCRSWNTLHAIFAVHIRVSQNALQDCSFLCTTLGSAAAILSARLVEREHTFSLLRSHKALSQSKADFMYGTEGGPDGSKII